MTRWFVYVLLNRAGLAYTGSTTDVARRLDEHNSGAGAKFTRGRGPWRLAHLEEFATRSAAQKREAAIKKDRAFKARLKAKTARGSRRSGSTSSVRPCG
jgi:putative endonuclease